MTCAERLRWRKSGVKRRFEHVWCDQPDGHEGDHRKTHRSSQWFDVAGCHMVTTEYRWNDDDQSKHVFTTSWPVKQADA